MTRLPLSANISLGEPHATIVTAGGIWQAPRRRVTSISGGWKMSRKVALGLVAMIAALTAVDISTAAADETGLASMHSLRREGGRLCMSDHWHYGSSGSERSRGAAQRGAIRSWQDFTDLEYGSSLARFSRAASRKVSCSRSGGGWSCNVEARPCK